MRKKTKKIIHIIMTVICGLIGFRYPKLEETAQDIIKDVEELTDDTTQTN